MKTVETARIYARVALLRRRVLLQAQLRRVAVGGLATLALLVAVAFGAAAAFMWFSAWLGPIAASAILAGVFLVLAMIGAAYALSKPQSPELEALEMMEAEARTAACAAAQQVTLTGMRVRAYGGSFLMALNLFRMLRNLLRGR